MVPRFVFCKKSQALNALLELLLIAVVIIILTQFVYSNVTSTSRYYAHETLNFALFLERIPSIDENFYFTYVLEENMSVQVSNTTIFMDAVGRQTLTFREAYFNPPQFQVEAFFPSIDTIHVYKIGDRIFLLEEQDEELERLLFQAPVRGNFSKDITFFGEGADSFTFALENLDVVVNTQRDFDSIRDFNNTLLWFNNIERDTFGIDAGELSSEFNVFYTVSARDEAFFIYNAILSGFREGSPNISLHIIPDVYDVPTILTISEKFGSYMLSVRSLT